MKAPLAVAALLALVHAPAAAQGPRSPNAADLAIELRKLNTLGAVLYVAAHPDDENTAFLAWAARERCVRAAYLSITRGDGGQNLIGGEKGPFLGILRTQELLAARRIDGAEQFFTRAVDFGYSKSPEETFRIWGKEATLGDVVWVIRKFRPDVIVTRFPKTGEGGHGHHTASAILAEEAFSAAADPARFPDQLRFVGPWQAQRILWNSWRPGQDPKAPAPGEIQVDLGAFNATLGRSYTEIAGESRSQHKSQGFGAAERRGTRLDAFQHLAGERASGDLFEGVDLSWSRVRGGEKVGECLAQAAREFDLRAPGRIVPLLVDAYGAMASLGADPWAEVKRRDLARAIEGAAGLVFEATAAAPTACPGEAIEIQAGAIVRSDAPVVLESVNFPFGGGAEVNAALKPNIPFQLQRPATIPADAPLPEVETEIHGHSGSGVEELGERLGRPEPAEPLVATFVARVCGTTIRFESPVVYRTVDSVKGEVRRPLRVVPPVSIEVAHPLVLVNPKDPRELSVTVTLRALADGVAGSLRAEADGNWAIGLEGAGAAKPKDAERSLEIPKKGEERSLTLQVRPLDGAAGGDVRLTFLVGKRAYGERVLAVDYSHITPQTLFVPARVRLVAVPLEGAARAVGYLRGSGDEVPEALALLGARVVELDDEALAGGANGGGLGRLDAIVVGVRAFNTRRSLAHLGNRLLEYVREGGTLVVQYNTLQDLVTREIGPYPFTVSRDRVTDEAAPVAFSDPANPILHVPNEITEKDFEGWVQERGLYFPGTWDERYAAPLAMGDPGEKPSRGAILVAHEGKGVFIYTSLAFFRQLPAGVPGAYRLFANLVAAKQRAATDTK